MAINITTMAFIFKAIWKNGEVFFLVFIVCERGLMIFLFRMMKDCEGKKMTVLT